MGYKVYIDGYFKLYSGDAAKWHMMEAVGKFFTKAEADKQAAFHLKGWQKIQNAKKGKEDRRGRPLQPYPVRSRIVKV